MRRALEVALGEVRWSVSSIIRLLMAAPGLALVLAGVVWLLPLVGLGLVLVVVAVRAWRLASRTTYVRVAGPVMASWWLWWVRRHWAELCGRCRLAPHDVPQIVGRRAAWPHIELVIRPAMGQTAADYEAASEALRTGVGASRVRVEPRGVRDVGLTLTIGDELAAPFDAAVPALEPLDSVVMGRREDGALWRLAIGPHTLVAGCSGSGKGSVFWSLAFALGPHVERGTVQLHGIDLKGGMEIRMGEGLFTTEATNAAEAVAALELLVGWMRERTIRYAGQRRTHTATAEEPLHVVMIDELAALTAYCPERDLQRRAETAINLLCSQGRAPGFMVFACLQDPRKEVIPSRGLFTQMVGLRLKDLSETSMVLGEIAVLTGAHCHRITRDVPGTGYVLPEDGTHPIRVRAGFASDEAIRDIAARFPTPARHQLVVPYVVDEDPEFRRRPRAPR